MGITCSWIAVRGEVTRVFAALEAAHGNLRLLEEHDLATTDELWAEHRRLHKRILETRECWVSYGYWQDDDWAVLVDWALALPFDRDLLGAISRSAGPILGLVIGTHSGSAGFTYYEGGRLTRSVFYQDGKTTFEGEPLAEEEGIDVDRFYWDEADELWAAFGLSSPYEGCPPVGLRVYDDAALRQNVAERAEKGPFAAHPRRRPWWKLW